MSWIVFDSETGAEIRRTETEPQLGEGEAAATVSAAPGAMWSPTLRGWLDPEPPLRRIMPLFEYLRLWTAEEAAWFKNTTDPIAAQAFVLTLGSPVIDLDHPDVIAGIAYAAQAIPLQPGRAEQIRAGIPPEETDT